MRLLFSAGEVSGDVAGAGLAAALLQRRPDLEMIGIGGDRMAAEGIEMLASTSHLGTVGVSEALSTIPSFWRAFLAIRRTVLDKPPAAAVVIGNDVYNTLLARWLHSCGIPVAAFFPPQVWIWGALGGPIARSFDLVLSCFPQEQEVYSRGTRRNRPEVQFVGHYLADRIRRRTPESIAAARQRLGLEPSATVLGLLPGSRQHEIRSLAPILFGAAQKLIDDGRPLSLVVPVADASLGPAVSAALSSAGLAGRTQVITNSSDILNAADLILLASGTASLEAALTGVPMVVAYKVSLVTHAIVGSAILCRLIDRDTVALPNLILGREVIPELKQTKATSTNVAAAARSLLDDDHRRNTMIQALDAVRERVGPGNTMDCAAEAIIDLASASVAKSG